MLSQHLLNIAAHVAPHVASWPRRQPGRFMVGDKAIRYADLHSFYHQVKQLFGQRLYNFRSATEAPRILDCGAHIGLASLFFKERFPGARITAFEADATLADLCRDNFAELGFSDIETIRAAVWTHDQGVAFSHSRDDAGHVAEQPDLDSLPVPTIRLRDLLAEQVDLLKLDVEGAEFALFEDCGTALSAAKHIVMEVHAMGDTQAKIGHLLSHIENLGFRYVLGDLHQATWLKTPNAPPFEYCKTEKFIVTVYAWQP